MNINKSLYPRPDFIRQDINMLDGAWDFLMDDENSFEFSNDFPDLLFNETIQVPYCYQSEASEIQRKEYCPVVWYRRIVPIDELSGRTLLLHFGAVDWACKVWVNGFYIGSHIGGNTPFVMNITHAVQENSENTVLIKVEDYLDPQKSQGKQSCVGEPFGCWYTPTTGIWQSVWLEYAGSVPLHRIKATPDVSNHTAKLEVWIESSLPTKVSLICTSENEWLGSQDILCTNGYGSCVFAFPDRDIRKDALLWFPHNPRLIDVEITVDGCVPDSVVAYFGLRQISIQNGVILLNGRPLYQRLILDQGYWPSTLMTPPSLKALEHDIDIAIQMGFNGARKHQKIEDPRYYYLADKKGFLLWGELPSSYTFNDTSMEYLVQEMRAFIERDYNHPSIIAWVPMNESWGIGRVIDNSRCQMFCKSLFYLIKAIDGTRFISTNDGWEQPGETDICAIHDYSLFAEHGEKYQHLDQLIDTYAEHRMLFAKGESYKRQPILITEFGGIAFDDNSAENWGYYGKVKDADAFCKRLASALEVFKTNRRIVGFCYTQLTDIMQETNGLLDANHIPKLEIEKYKELFSFTPM